MTVLGLLTTHHCRVSSCSRTLLHLKMNFSFFSLFLSLYFVFFFFFFLGMWYVSAICGFQKLCVFHFSKIFSGFSLAISDKGLTFALAFRNERLLWVSGVLEKEFFDRFTWQQEVQEAGVKSMPAYNVTNRQDRI